MPTFLLLNTVVGDFRPALYVAELTFSTVYYRGLQHKVCCWHQEHKGTGVFEILRSVFHSHIDFWWISHIWFRSRVLSWSSCTSDSCNDLLAQLCTLQIQILIEPQPAYEHDLCSIKCTAPRSLKLCFCTEMTKWFEDSSVLQHLKLHIYGVIPVLHST